MQSARAVQVVVNEAIANTIFAMTGVEGSRDEVGKARRRRARENAKKREARALAPACLDVLARSKVVAS
jgi:hypothetical protein